MEWTVVGDYEAAVGGVDAGVEQAGKVARGLGVCGVIG